MKRTVKKLLSLAMALALAASLTACDLFGDNMIADSQTLIQGTLDNYYLGKFDKAYMDLIDLTEAEAQEQYDDWASQEANLFCQYFSVEFPTDDYKARVTETIKEIYSHAKYTVKPATKLSSGDYAVEVEVEPMDVMLLVTNEETAALWESLISEEALAEYDLENMSDADADLLYEQIDAQYADQVLEMVKAQIPNLGYETAVAKVFQIKKDTDGLYQMAQADFQDFDTYIISYNY